jgi:hypothetical protein
MKRRRFLKNTRGVSLMYDAVLFIVMVSLSRVVLLPALQSDIAIDTSIEKHREHVADEALNTFLVSRVDTFSYKMCGDIIDDAAKSIGINTSSEGLYSSILDWLLAREQNHKTHANLLAENLGCQFRLPFSVFGTNRFNIFTGDYDRQLKNETKSFFSSYLGDKYSFNLTTWWHPIKGVPFGGELYIGEHPPNQDCHVAKSFIMMPYKPVINLGDTQIIFTKYWMKEELFGGLFGDIPLIANITSVIENYTGAIPPYDDFGNATNAVRENVTMLVYGFLIDGIRNSNNETVFPGIINATLDYGFNKLKTAIGTIAEDAVSAVMGEALGTVDSMFADIVNDTVSNPIFDEITNILIENFTDFLGESIGSLAEGFDALEMAIKENVTSIVASFMDPYIQYFVDSVFESIDIDVLIDFEEMISNWLFERISLNKAEVVLTVWVTRR